MAHYRKDLLITGEYYHIFNRSISKYVIFNNKQEYSRVLELINLLRFINFNYQYSQFKRFKLNNQYSVLKNLKLENKTFVEIIAYCIMPTHLHLLLRQNSGQGITKYMGKLLNSYSKYFNTIHRRSGPLWVSRFKNKIVENDEQLLHLTRYIHLNPTSAGLISKPENWNYSSYKEYIGKHKDRICNYKHIIKFNSVEYKKFVDDRKDVQQQISKIKYLLIENYTG